MKTALLFLMIAPFLATSQIKFNGGIKFGTTVPMFTTLTEGSKNQPGIAAGITTGIGTDKMGAIIDVYYSGFGIINSSTGSLELGYVSVPVMLRRSLNKVFEAHVGPEFSFLVKSKAASEEAKYLTNNVDVGLGAGFRVKPIPILFLDARYSFGLNKIYTISESKVNKFHISLGFSF